MLKIKIHIYLIPIQDWKRPDRPLETAGAKTTTGILADEPSTIGPSEIDLLAKSLPWQPVGECGSLLVVDFLAAATVFLVIVSTRHHFRPSLHIRFREMNH